MRKSRKNDGFSLTEVLLSVGILSVGMIFIAGVFPVGIHFTTIAAERTIAAIVADEAFAKIKIYAFGELNDETDDVKLDKLDELKNFNDTTVFPATGEIKPDEFTYPSTDTNSPKQYCWSALCRRVGADPSRLVQVTVFVSRRTRAGLKYHEEDGGENGAWPVPVPVDVSATSGNNELTIESGEKTYINDGYMIVDNETGRIYRVLERYRPPKENTILLDRDWDAESGSPVWVVPPPANGSRYPCIAIYQKVIGF